VEEIEEQMVSEVICSGIITNKGTPFGVTERPSNWLCKLASKARKLSEQSFKEAKSPTQ